MTTRAANSPDDPTAPGGASDPRPLSAKIAGAASDEELLRSHGDGDPQAFAELIDRYREELFHFLIRFLGDRASAEDIFQEAFLQVHQSLHQFDLSRRFRPWLFTIAANKARDYLRSASRKQASPLQASVGSSDDDDGGEFIDLLEANVELPDEPLARLELRQKVQRVVMGMPEHLREILLLSYFHQFPYKQIGEMLDIPLGTVKSRLHAAVAHFAEKWRSANPGGLET